MMLTEITGVSPLVEFIVIPSAPASLVVFALSTVIHLNPSHPIFSTLRAAFWSVETAGNKTRLFGSREDKCVSTLYARHDLIFHPGLP